MTSGSPAGRGTRDVPLVSLLVSTQTLNAILLVPLLVVMHLLSRDREIMGSTWCGPLSPGRSLRCW